MDTILIAGSVMLAAVAAFFIWILVSDSRAMKKSGVIPANEMATGSTAGQPGGSETDYGATDCFYDCMRAFQWESKEESPCASACGLKP
ncbi:MAG: hypothetical protein ACLP5H_27695 [Desulfomonilaceae bacterium]